MPTYEFRCPDGHEFEKFYRSISGAEAQASCPVCGKPAERMMSAAGFAFKGSGFYLTDYGKNAHRGEAPPGATAAAKADGASSTDSSSDSAKSESAKSESAAPAKADGAKSDSAKPSDSSAGSGESKKAESKKAESKAESKPAPAAPKPSAGE
jgi:putative FmdB family regulatory protein